MLYNLVQLVQVISGVGIYLIYGMRRQETYLYTFTKAGILLLPIHGNLLNKPKPLHTKNREKTEKKLIFCFGYVDFLSPIFTDTFGGTLKDKIYLV